MRIDIKTLVGRILDHAGFHQGLDFPKLPALIRRLQHSPTASNARLAEDVRAFVPDSSQDLDDATLRDICRSLVTNPDFHLENEGDKLGIEITLQLFDTASLDKVFEDLRLVPSENRVWIALTGHAIDYRQTNREQIDLLMRIAAAGEKGIHVRQLCDDTKKHARAIGIGVGSLYRQGHVVRTGQERGSVTLPWVFHIRFRDTAASFIPPPPKPSISVAKPRTLTSATFDPKHVGEIETRVPAPLVREAPTTGSLRRDAFTAPTQDGPADAAYRSWSVSRPYTSILENSIGETTSSARPPKARATLPDPPNISEFYRSFLAPPNDRSAYQYQAPPSFASPQFDPQLTQPDIGLTTPPASRRGHSHDGTFPLLSKPFAPSPQVHESPRSNATYNELRPHKRPRISNHSLGLTDGLASHFAPLPTSSQVLANPYMPSEPSPLAAMPIGDPTVERPLDHAGAEKRKAHETHLIHDQEGVNKRMRINLPSAPLFRATTWKKSVATSAEPKGPIYDYDSLYMNQILQLPGAGAYVFRPLRYAGETGYMQGRPRKKIIFVVKSDGLAKMDWFRNSFQEQRMQLLSQNKSQDQVPYKSPDWKASPSSILIVRSAKLQDLMWFFYCTENDRLNRNAPLHRTRRIEAPYERSVIDATSPIGSDASFNGIGVAQDASINSVPTSPIDRQRYPTEAPSAASAILRANTLFDHTVEYMANHQLHEQISSKLVVFGDQAQPEQAKHAVEDASMTATEAFAERTSHASRGEIESHPMGTEKVSNVQQEARLPQSSPALPAQTGHPSIASTVTSSLPTGSGTVRSSSSISSQVDSSHRQTSEKRSISAGTISSRKKQLTSVQKRGMLLGYVRKAQGAFPGDEVLWYPFATELRRTRDRMPHKAPLPGFVDEMVDAGHLNRAVFSFMASNGEEITRRVVYLPTLNENSPAVTTCKHMIELSHPGMYIPEEVQVDYDIEPGLKARQAVRKLRQKTHSTADRQKTGANTQAQQLTSPRSMMPSQSLPHAQSNVDAELLGDIEEEQLPPTKTTPTVRHQRSSILPATHAPPSVGSYPPPSIPSYLYQDFQVHDGEAADAPNGEQLSLQYIFQIGHYVHDQSAAPTGMDRRRAKVQAASQSKQGNKIDKPRLQSSCARLQHPVHSNSQVAPVSNAPATQIFALDSPKTVAVPAFTHQPLNETSKQSDSAPENSSHALHEHPRQMRVPSKLVWIEDELTKDASVQNALHESYLQVGHTGEHASRSEALNHGLNNPSSWLTSFDRLCRPSRSGKAGVRLCITLSDPDQCFNPKNGTFSTEFGVVRNTRPTLTINTSIQRSFENTLPKSLKDITGAMRKKRKNTQLSDFDRSINAVKSWETKNEVTLTSDKSLMVPRFINHYAHDISQQSPLATGSTPLRSPPLSPAPVSEADDPLFNAARTPTHCSGSSAPTMKHVTPGSHNVLTPIIDSSPTRHSSRKHVPSQKLMQLKEAENLRSHNMPTASNSRAPTASWSQTPRSHTTHTTQNQDDNVGRSDTGIDGAVNRSMQSSKGPGVRPCNDNNASGDDDDDGDCSSAMRPAADLQARHASDRLIVTLIIVRTLFQSPSPGVVVWGLVCKVFPDFALATLKSRWAQLQNSHKQLINWFQGVFEEQYLLAYEQDQVPSLNYRDPESFDIESTIQWALTKFHTKSITSKSLPPWPATPKAPTFIPTAPISIPKTPTAQDDAPLPSSRQKLDECFEMRPVATKSSRPTTDALWNHTSKESNRREALQALDYCAAYESLGKPQKTSHTGGIHKESDNSVATTLVRANSLTPSAIYDTALTEKRLSTVSPNSLQRAIAHLRDRGIIQTRNRVASKVTAAISSANAVVTNPPDTDPRTYILDPSFIALFNDKSTWSPSTLRAAASYKVELDAAFGPNLDGEILSPVHPTEGQTICLFQLNALRQITATPVIDPEAIDKMMHTGKMESHMNPRMRTSANKRLYVRGLGLLNATVLEAPSPQLDPSNMASSDGPESEMVEQRIPLWYSINDTLLVPVWEHFVCMVLQIVVSRGSTTEEDVVKALKGKVETWDVQLVVRWMVERGVVLRDAGADRVKPTEWWWGVFGAADVDKGMSKGKMRAE